MAETTDSLVGTMLGPCRLEALVGRGGMGRVYRARHVALDRIVAVKLVDQSGSAALREIVLNEARAAAKLDDPGIVAVYDVGEDKGLSFIVLQWVEGENLDVRVRHSPLPPAEALAIVREVVTALRAAHSAGLVHCDVKPANILLDRRGGVKLADFGIARQTGSAAAAGDTVSGSFHFMAPEQALGSPPDPRADLYAVGATWYYILTGQMLYPGTPLGALARHRDEPPPDVRKLRPEVTEKCAALIQRLLAKDPAERPRSADALLSELSAVDRLLAVNPANSAGTGLFILPPPPREPDIEVLAEPDASVAAPRHEPAFVPPSPPASPAFVPTPPPASPAFVSPPPPPPALALGSRRTFFFLFAVIAFAAVAWPWRGAVAEDWLAGAAFLASFTALLTIGDRMAVWRKAAGIALWLGALACFGRYVRGIAGIPPLETLIAAGVGAVCAGGAVYLGLWGEDMEDPLWARGLAPLGGVLLAVGALTWSVPESRGWLDVLADEGARAWRAWWTTGGAWRWGSLAVSLAAIMVVRRLKTVSAKPTDRKLNWNL